MGLAIGVILSNYLFGSLPFGLLISNRLEGVDPRGKGSGNIGASNVLRVAGKKAAILTLICDLVKGIPLVIISEWIRFDKNVVLFVALAAILGHIFSIFLWFKGGKGVATGFGVILVLSPKIALAGLIIWIIAVYFSKYAAVGALAAYGAVPFLAFTLQSEKNFVIFSSTVAFLIYFRHWDNICRLVQGKETRF